jgi:hypothetical protein
VKSPVILTALIL